MATGSLQRLLDPRSVAVVGASDKPGALGASVLANLARNGFGGAIHLVNPGRSQIGDRPCLPTVAALPLGIDVAILAVPRATVVAAVAALAQRQTGAAIVFAAGFAEDGPEGLADQQQLAAIARDAGMIVEGPNCLGLVNHQTGAALTFVETTVTPPAEDQRGIGIISQSGAMAAALGTMLQARALGLTLSVSTGNEAANGIEDFLEHLAEDAATQVIALIAEHIRQPQRFLAAARAAAAAGKTIVLLHPGRSAAARASAVTHTGALAGDHAVMRLLVGRAGVVLVETLEELVDVTELSARCPTLPRDGVAVVGESGAYKALTLDLAEELGLGLPPLDARNAPALRAALPPFAGVSNPLDVTAQGLADPRLYTDTLAALLNDERIGVVLAGIIQTDPATMAIKLPAVLAAIDAGPNKPVVFAGLDEGAPLPAGMVAQLRARGVPYLPSSERALRAITRLVARQAPAQPIARTAEMALDVAAEAGTIPEFRAAVLLGRAGVVFPPAHLATSAAEARAAADAIGYPVVMKAQAAALAHKSEAGGVAVGLADGEAVERAWPRMVAAVTTAAPLVKLDGILVQAMAAAGVEMIVGARRDPDWGPVVLIGFGGVQAEMLDDVRLVAPDMTRVEIEHELRQLRGAALFDGWRGGSVLDVPALVDLVLRVGSVMRDTPRIVELDLNPVILRANGHGLVALDALLQVADDVRSPGESR